MELLALGVGPIAQKARTHGKEAAPGRLVGLLLEHPVLQELSDQAGEAEILASSLDTRPSSHFGLHGDCDVPKRTHYTILV
jgi:hypothetical protein